ncbi:GNAT family N-acetyltransferase [Streptomyces sp. NPDC056600]|uniref:GNAT family N-acetyltransferase n=1 Tax=Streptomyces sp. NPDC056600 TaxID=3345874 RepID=UPI0036AC90D7
MSEQRMDERQLRLEPVTPDNLDTAIGIEVAPEQSRFVTPVVKSLAQAYVYPEAAWPRLIRDGDRAVGFLMAFLDIDWRGDGSRSDVRSGLWRLNIAADEQRRGYGAFAVRAVAEEIRRRGGSRFYVTWEQGEDGPEEFYLRLGFRKTGELSGEQIVGVLDLGEAG